MTEYYLLEELVTFARVGTLAKTAEELGLTQPALTHSMKKLEDDLGVTLFKRTPNRIFLTETGKYAAREAKKLLDANQNFAQKVQNFEQNQETITVASNAPGPMIVLDSLREQNIKTKADFIESNGEQLLAEGQITCLLSNKPLDMQDITSIYLGSENMSINVAKDSPLATKSEVRFKDLAGQTIISMENVGFWSKIYQSEVPNGKFIFQNRANEYSEILNYSSLPFFTTNITPLIAEDDQQWRTDFPKDRISVPIKDKSAHQKFYAIFLKRDRKRLEPLIQKLQDQWEKVDE